MIEFDENISEELKDEISDKSAWIVGKDIVPSVYYRAFSAKSAWNADDESTYRIWIDSEETELSEAEVMSGPIEEIELVLSDNGATEPGAEGAENVKVLELVGNRFEFANPGEVAAVSINPSSDLASIYSDTVNVIVDGKSYSGLGILANPLKFNMDRDHKIVIDWLHGEIYESFRIIVNR